MEAHRGLIDLLEEHTGYDARERGDLERMVQFAHVLEQPFSRHQPEAHFTASALLVDRDNSRTCLVHHRNLLKWVQPGGHFEPEDEGDLVRAALREVLEETACRGRPHAGVPTLFDADIHTIPARADRPAHLHLDLRILVVADDPAQLRFDPNESLDARWLTWEAANELADGPALKRALEKAQSLASG